MYKAAWLGGNAEDVIFTKFSLRMSNALLSTLIEFCRNLQILQTNAEIHRIISFWTFSIVRCSRE